MIEEKSEEEEKFQLPEAPRAASHASTYRVASMIPVREYSDPRYDWTAGNETRLGLLARVLLKFTGGAPRVLVCPAGYFKFEWVKPGEAADSVASAVSEMLRSVAPKTTVIAGLDVRAGALTAQSVVAVDKSGLRKQVYKLFPTDSKTPWGSSFFERIDLSLATTSLADRVVEVGGRRIALAVCYDAYGMHEAAVAPGRTDALKDAATQCGALVDISAVKDELQAIAAWKRQAPSLVVNCVHDFESGAGRFPTQWGKLCEETGLPVLASAFYTGVDRPALHFLRRPDPHATSGGSAVAPVSEIRWYADHRKGGDWMWVQCFDLI